MIDIQSQPQPCDFDLTSRIANHLASQHFANLRRLKVSADKGVVTIRGQVPSFHQRQLCISACRQIEGVVQIDDRIVVTPVVSTVA
jgi:osmotically-inducible protein OsmY